MVTGKAKQNNKKMSVERFELLIGPWAEFSGVYLVILDASLISYGAFSNVDVFPAIWYDVDI